MAGFTKRDSLATYQRGKDTMPCLQSALILIIAAFTLESRATLINYEYSGTITRSSPIGISDFGINAGDAFRFSITIDSDAQTHIDSRYICRLCSPLPPAISSSAQALWRCSYSRQPPPAIRLLAMQSLAISNIQETLASRGPMSLSFAF